MTFRSQSELVGLAILLSLTGCHHQARVTLMVMTPIATTSVPPPTHTSEPMPFVAVESVPALTLQLPHQPLPRFRPRPTTARQLGLLLPAPPTPPVTLGVLSTDAETNDHDLHKEIETLLLVQQQRLSSLPRSAALLHNQQVEQAHFFMRQAFEAWRNHDTEGARVLAVKTKLLIDEM